MIGYVYLMINPAFPNLVKIGRTSKSSEARAMELSTTGTPDKFIVVFDILVDDCIELESEMHSIFTSSRYANNREFFEIPLKTAIETLQSIAKDRTVDEGSLSQEGANCVLGWQTDIVRYYLYCAFLGDVNTKTHESFLPKDRFFRFGLVSCEVVDDDLDEQLSEIRIQQDLSKDLIEYYQNFGWIDFNEDRIKISPTVPVKFILFHHVFDMGRSQRTRLESIVKGIISQKIDVESKLGWKNIFDLQSVVHLPYAYNDIGAQAIYFEINQALDDYYFELKSSEDEIKSKNSLKEAQSKKGNF